MNFDKESKSKIFFIFGSGGGGGGGEGGGVEEGMPVKLWILRE